MLNARIVGALAVLAALVPACPATAHDRATDAGAMFRSPASRTDALRGAAAFGAAAVPSGFAETTVWSGLADPIAVRFAADGRVFVLEQGGVIKQFDSPDDPSATVWADLSDNVHKFWDRGALGMALDPRFTDGRPYVYLLYVHDAPVGGAPPTWGDGCPTPPGPTTGGCVVGGRLSKVSQGGGEQVLVEDWCQQYPSHSVGTVAFGPDGALYASAGEGASFEFADYGAHGSPVNPCGDPPGGPGGEMAPPAAEGGALRAQDLRTGGDPTGLSGAVIRVDPDTGAALPDNPNAGSSDPNARRIVAHGLRNPFRWAFRPGTSELYIGDVGWHGWDEIDRMTAGGAVENFGWPCYEGEARQDAYDAAGLDVCEDLYAAGAGAITPPLYAYDHVSPVSADRCPVGGASISGIAFYAGAAFPGRYSGAMFFSDYARNCIWVMFPGADGAPDPATREPFHESADGPVDIQAGPDGALWWVSLSSDSVRRIQAVGPAGTPIAQATATPRSGAAPLTVTFDAGASSDPDGGPLTYAWDLDGDGAYDDSAAQTTTFTYLTRGVRTVRLRVTDAGGAVGEDTLTITVGTPPAATIDAPVAGTAWRVGEPIAFSGHATGEGGGPLPAAGLTWRLVVHHCSALVPTSCHEHEIRTFKGAADSFAAPDHEYPSHLELELTADDGALSTTVSRRLDPRTVDLTLQSRPPGAKVAVAGEAQGTPFGRTVIQASTVSLIVDSPQTLGSGLYDFVSWSDGGARAHSITAPAEPTTYVVDLGERVSASPPQQETASPPPRGPVGAWGFDETKGRTARDASGTGNAGRLTGPERVVGGRYGPGLSLDGVNDLVTVPDSASLALTTAATLEAWVRPAARGARWRSVLFKERARGLAYGLYAHAGRARPSGNLFIPGAGEQIVRAARAPQVGRWSHLAMTWDGATVRLYLDAEQIAARAQSGRLVDAAGPLRIGGNAVWAEWFRGRIDEVRVYDRALGRSEIVADMGTPVSGPGAASAARALAAAKARRAGQGGSKRARARRRAAARRRGHPGASRLHPRAEARVPRTGRSP